MTAGHENPELLDGKLDRAIDAEYAAISTPAVLGLILSIAGASAILVVPLIALPVLGLILGIVADRKIRRSQGVLTGRPIAIAAIAIGAILTVAAGARHASDWLHEREVLTGLETRAYAVVDDCLAERYQKVYETMPEEFRKLQAAGPNQFRARLAPLLRNGGAVVNRSLMSLQIARNPDGTVIAPAEMRVELERRYLDMTIWFKQTPDGNWDLVGVAGQETFDSLSKFPAPAAPPPK
jgi:hypothetical protein